MIAPKDILITDYVDPLLLTGLHLSGFHTTYAPEMSKSEMESLLPHYRGVVVNTRCAVRKEAMQNASGLKWIARLGSGLDIIDLEDAARMNIAVLSAPEGNAQAVAEHAMAMLLCLSNRLIHSDREVREGFWFREHNRGWEISGKTIGIIGYGNNGSAFGKLWKGWNVKVLAYDKYLENYGDETVIEVDLETLQKSSDIISLHIPLTHETNGMVNQAFLENCKEGAVIINTSRGKVVSLGALVDALKSGHIRGVCLDVLEYEPPYQGPDPYQKIFEELCALEDVVLSPHIAGWTAESKSKIAEVLLEKIKLLNEQA